MAELLWREWGKEAFAEARTLDRPILLDIGAVWCHWCHVMDHGIPGDPIHSGTYSNPEVVAAINRDYIPIKVDNDRRPDINARYNMGGWPTTAFLTPSGDPIYGATYLTPDQMLGLLENIAEYYKINRVEITEKLREMSERRDSTSRVKGELTQEIPAYVGKEIKRSFDRAFGGFGTQPKFPHPEALNFCLEQYADAADEELRVVAVKTILEMASGGMYDQFAGGFFRYSTTRDWSIPHYEKMLEDNSRLLKTCLLAYSVFKDEQFKDIALDVKRFLLEVMFDPSAGTFAGSQDADLEDAYYGRPLAERELMTTPFIDWTVYLDWNALVVSGFAELYKQLGDNAALDIAIRLYDFLTVRVAPSHFFANDVRNGPINQLSDVVALSSAAIDLYESTGLARYLSEARGLADIALSDLYSNDSALFRDTPVDPAALGSLTAHKYEQEDNALAALLLLRLSSHTGSTKYKTAAEAVLSSLAGVYREQSYFASTAARAVSAYLSPQKQIVLVGSLTSPEMKELKSAAYRSFALNKIVVLKDGMDSFEYLPDPEGRPVAYVCVGTTCSRPVTTTAELLELIAL